MRDQGFIAAHRGGPLSLEHHRQLMGWARACAGHVLRLLNPSSIDGRLPDALAVAEAWQKGQVRVGAAQKAAVAAHAAAREAPGSVAIAVARAVGHAVATAHMADHSLGAAYYALKAVKAAGKSVQAEQRWQEKRIPAELRERVTTAWALKFKKGS
jgi:hypothetical protein